MLYPKYLSIIAIATLLASCGSNKLTRKKAEQILTQEIQSGSEYTNFKICDNPPEDGFRAGYGDRHPCAKYRLKASYLPFLKKHPMLKMQSGIYVDRSLQTHYFDYAIGINPEYENQAALVNFTSDVSEPGHHIINVGHYKYEYGNIVGIRLLEPAENGCDAIVEYEYNRYDKAPWADTFIGEVKKYPTIYKACFQKYDDGWRYDAQSE